MRERRGIGTSPDEHSTSAHAPRWIAALIFSFAILAGLCGGIVFTTYVHPESLSSTTIPYHFLLVIVFPPPAMALVLAFIGTLYALPRISSKHVRRMYLIAGILAVAEGFALLHGYWLAQIILYAVFPSDAGLSYWGSVMITSTFVLVASFGVNLVVLGLLFRVGVLRRGRRALVCHACDYDLRGLTGATCPECGAEVQLTGGGG